MAGPHEDSSDRSNRDNGRPRTRRLTKSIGLVFCLGVLVLFIGYMSTNTVGEQGSPPVLVEPTTESQSTHLPTHSPAANPTLTAANPTRTDASSGNDSGQGREPGQKPPRRQQEPPLEEVPGQGEQQEPSVSPYPADPDQELDAFISSCAQGRFRKAQVDYPRTLPARLGRATTYGAAVDIRDTPAPPDKVIDAADPTSADDVKVECAVAAKLVSVGGGISVDAADTPDDGWIYLVFPPSGVLEWSWSVTPREPVSQQLRLELKPTAKIDDRYDRNKRGTAVYVTTVNVTATPIDRLAYWFQTQWGPLTAIAGSIGVAILAILTFSSKARDAVKRLFTKQPPQVADTKSSDHNLDVDEDAQHEDKQTDKPSTKTKTN